MNTTPPPSRQRDQLALSFATVLSTSLTVDQLSERVQVTPSRIRQRLNQERTLWGFKVGPRHQWRVPAWELSGDELLPGIDVVAKAIPANMHPVAVERLVSSPNPDLIRDGEAVSVREWLAAGNSPEMAAAAIGEPSRLV